MGVDPRRGDVVSVVSMPFDGGAGLPVAEKPTAVELVRDFQRPIINLVALLLAAYIALKLVRGIRPPAPLKDEDEPAPAPPPCGGSRAGRPPS